MRVLHCLCPMAARFSECGELLLISGTIRLVHWDEEVRSRWRAALSDVTADVIESQSLAGTGHSRQQRSFRA